MRRVIGEVSLSLSILLIMWNSLEYFLPKNLMIFLLLFCNVRSRMLIFLHSSQPLIPILLKEFYSFSSDVILICFMRFDNECRAKWKRLRLERKGLRLQLRNYIRYDKWWIIQHAISSKLFNVAFWLEKIFLNEMLAL